jgi:hypothetical protein
MASEVKDGHEVVGFLAAAVDLDLLAVEFASTRIGETGYPVILIPRELYMIHLILHTLPQTCLVFLLSAYF